MGRMNHHDFGADRLRRDGELWGMSYNSYFHLSVFDHILLRLRTRDERGGPLPGGYYKSFFDPARRKIIINRLCLRIRNKKRVFSYSYFSTLTIDGYR